MAVDVVNPTILIFLSTAVGIGSIFIQVLFWKLEKDETFFTGLWSKLKEVISKVISMFITRWNPMNNDVIYYNEAAFLRIAVTGVLFLIILLFSIISYSIVDGAIVTHIFLYLCAIGLLAAPAALLIITYIYNKLMPSASSDAELKRNRENKINNTQLSTN